MATPRILRTFGYRTVLVSNTVMLGALIALFATVGAATPVWLIVIQAFVLGFFTSLQYTSMNTLVYSDVSAGDASAASTIASTMQQMSMSFGVATASLVTAVFIPDRFHASAPEIIRGIHRAFLVLAVLTVASTVVFKELRPEDGAATSLHKGLEQDAAMRAAAEQ
jgi:MFS family permease